MSMNEYELKQNFTLENVQMLTAEGRERRIRSGIPVIVSEICYAARAGNNKVHVREEYCLKEIFDYFTGLRFEVDRVNGIISW